VEYKMRILVVDDEAPMLKLLETILKKDGYDVIKAQNGFDALEIVKTERIDLVISDIKMPKMNGFELLKRLKAENPKIGVIIMTGYGEIFTVKDALLLGADEYITKPFKTHEISLVVEKTIWRLNSTNKKEQSTGK